MAKTIPLVQSVPVRPRGRAHQASHHATTPTSGWPVLSRVEQRLVEILHARGGRLWMVDLVFELRMGGGGAEAVRRGLETLVDRGLVRPLAHLAYELTASGWESRRR